MGLHIMALNVRGTESINTMHGIIMGTNTNNNPLAARVFIKRLSDQSKDNNMMANVLDIKKVVKEIGSENLEKLNNQTSAESVLKSYGF